MVTSLILHLHIRDRETWMQRKKKLRLEKLGIRVQESS